MFFIHNDQTQRWHRREDGQPRANHDARLTAQRSSEMPGTRCFSDFTMQTDHWHHGKTRGNACLQQRREIDLRHQ